jgi:uncharacterized membrane protein
MEGLAEAVHWVAVAIELMAVLVIAYAALEAFAATIRVVATRVSVGARRAMMLRFLHLLVLGLTFQLAADFVHIALARDWDEVGRVAVIAVIRTFLGFFLDRDVRAASEENAEAGPA